MTRNQIAAAYDKAVATMNSASTIEAFEAASASVQGLRGQLIAAEQTSPTSGEVRRESNRRYLRNIGMDVA